MIARRYIIPGCSKTHTFFRCHNRQMFFRESHVKRYLVGLWAKYKHKYGIKIFEAIIMDNHAHLLLESPNSDALGQFMRTVNSLLARYINRHLQRDSQAIRERYHSPLITTETYFKQAMVYIWFNRHKATGAKPLEDRFCSATWRCYPQVLVDMAEDHTQRQQLAVLLDADEAIYPSGRKIGRFVRNLLNAWLGRASQIATDLMESSHTIGDADTVNFRAQQLHSMKKEAVPWTPIPA